MDTRTTRSAAAFKVENCSGVSGAQALVAPDGDTGKARAIGQDWNAKKPVCKDRLLACDFVFDLLVGSLSLEDLAATYSPVS